MQAPRPESSVRLLGELPSANGSEKIEVCTRTDEEGNPVLELVEYRWGSGLGWYVQKRMTLDAEQARLLGGLLNGAPCTARPVPPARRLRRTASVRARDGNVIQLQFAS